jgi:hypothetical protein
MRAFAAAPVGLQLADGLADSGSMSVLGIVAR